MNHSPYGYTVHLSIRAQMRQHLEQRSAALAQIRTAADAEKYVRRVRGAIAKCFGEWPERTPLKATVTRLLERERYTVEGVVFQSRPGAWVTANLYRPRGEGKFPAVLVPLGHCNNGKSMATYQCVAQRLANQGFAVLVYDPFGQGERRQFDHVDEKLRPMGAVEEHQMAGKQLALSGEFFGSWRVWDGMRALDFLLAQKGVDRTRVGVTGNSGGGTLTSYLFALDARFTMAAPGCFMTSYQRNFDNELAADIEQCPPGILGAGIDLADFVLARAPKPVILLGQERDFFDVRGLRGAFEEVRKVYRALGVEELVRLHVGPGFHGYQPDAQEAMVKFFCEHAGVRMKSEGPLKAEEETSLHAAPGGSVANLPGNRMISELARGIAKRHRMERGVLRGPALAAAARRVLCLPSKQATPAFDTLREFSIVKADKHPRSVSAFKLHTHDGCVSVLYSTRTQRQEYEQAPPVVKDATLYLPHLSSEEDFSLGHAPVETEVLFALDVRGAGRVRPLTTEGWDVLSPYTQDYFYAAHYWMLGQSVIGLKVSDALEALNLLQSRGTRSVHLVGRGLGAVTAAFTALLHPVVTRVTLVNGPRSFEEWVKGEVVAWPYSVLPWGVLREFDLAEVFGELKAKGLRASGAWDAVWG